MKFFFDIDKDKEYSFAFVCFSILNIITLGRIKFIKRKLVQIKAAIEDSKKLR